MKVLTEKYSKNTLVVKDQKCFNPNVGGGEEEVLPTVGSLLITQER